MVSNLFAVSASGVISPTSTISVLFSIGIVLFSIEIVLFSTIISGGSTSSVLF